MDANPAHPLRRATDRPPVLVRRHRAIGIAWFSAMAVIVALAGPLFVCFFGLGAVSALGLRQLA